MKIRLFVLLGIISITLFVGCESDWYPIYEDWLCTINVDGTNLEYVRNSYGNFLLSPDRQTLIEYTNNKFYSVDLNDLSSRTLLVDYGDDLSAIYKPALSNNNIVFLHHGDIFIYDIASINIHEMDTGNAWDLNISDDGNLIIYTTLTDSTSSIVIINTIKNIKSIIFEIENIDMSKYYLESPRFVDNDEKILFSMHGNQYCTTANGIYSVNVDDSDFHCIVEENYTDYITVSTDEDYILYIFDQQIHLVSINEMTDHILDLTYNEFFFPSFSPEGQKILFAKEDYPYIISFDGTNKYKLIDRMIGYSNSSYRESYFLDNYTILLPLKTQIN